MARTGQRGGSRLRSAFSILGEQDLPVATDPTVVALVVVFRFRDLDDPVGEDAAQRVDSLSIQKHVPLYRMGQDISDLKACAERAERDDRVRLRARRPG